MISKTGCWRTKSMVPVMSTKGPSGPLSPVKRPSMTISQSEGTSRSTVLQRSSVTGPRFAARSSSLTSGAGERAAAKSTCMGALMQIAASALPPRCLSAVSVPRFSTTRTVPRSGELIMSR